MKLRNSLAALGVRRPVLISVINLLIILAGLAAVMGVSVRELPNVEHPMVTVRAKYVGASPETMDSEVGSILEGAVAQVPGVEDIVTESEEENARVKAEFRPGYDLNTAANDIRESISRIQRQLPKDLQSVNVTKANDDAQAIMQISAFSNSLSKEELSRRVEQDIAPQFLSVDGVADTTLNGDQPPVLRVVMDPARMAANRVTASDVIQTMRNAQFDVPAGTYKSGEQAMIVRAYASVVDPEKIEQLSVRGNIRIGDIAQVFYAPATAFSYTYLNGRMVVGLSIIRQPGANTIAIANEVHKRVKRINAQARDYQLQITSDDSVYIKGALKEVLMALVFAIVIVLAVIGLFLGQWRAVLVPAVTLPVALIGTLAGMWLCGFSINLLTLLALVLATGLIVDDAIVVLENIQRRGSRGLGKMAAAVLGTEQVFFAVLATTVTLIAVFLPIAFIGGDIGPLFREFSLVLAISVAISMFVAFSLCPMLASRLPEVSADSGNVSPARQALNRIGRASSGFYYHSLERILQRPVLFLGAALVIAAAGVLGFLHINRELVPAEDQGQIIIQLTGPPSANQLYADRQAQKVEAILRPYVDSGLVTGIYSVIGWKDPNRAEIIAPLKDWGDRDVSQMALEKALHGKLASIIGAHVVIAHQNSLHLNKGGTGSGGELQIALLGNDYDKLDDAAQKFSAELKKRIPEIDDVNEEYDTAQTQMHFSIDREKARDLKVPLSSIAETLQSMVDEYEVIDFYVNDASVPVMLSSSNGAITSPSDLLNIFVMNQDNQLVPLSAMVSVKETGVADQLDRYARHRSIVVDIGFPPGTAIGTALQRITNVADQVLPAGMSLLPLGEAASFNETSHALAVTFLIALAVVFLVLAAQFESLGSAVIVIFTVPFGLAAAVFALLYTGQTLNLYTQIGFVMLIGLMTKNAILLVDFMDQMRDAGMNVHDAIMQGVRVRLRPVAMTVLATVFGSLPLILSVGPGMEARRAIGWVIFGGLGLSTLFTLYLTPLGYSLIAPHIKTRSHAGERLEEQLQNAVETGPGGHENL